MGNVIGKAHPRLIAVDDGAFDRGDTWAPLAVVVVSLPEAVESVALGRVAVDGRDATDVIETMVTASPGAQGGHAILLDGITVGGFNLIDMARLHRRLGKPVIALTRRPPDFDRVRAALRKYFPNDFRRRWRLASAHRLFPVRTSGEPLWAAVVGCRRADAISLLQRSALRGFWPEPLRLAHLIAHAAGAGGLTGGRGKSRRDEPI
ncbi:MAG: DUF99 family protein [Thermoplasmata archaeon]